MFDECHRAKNVQVGKDGAGPKTANAVIELQDSLPNARVVYVLFDSYLLQASSLKVADLITQNTQTGTAPRPYFRSE